jgi:hypothetical protein
VSAGRFYQPDWPDYHGDQPLKPSIAAPVQAPDRDTDEPVTLLFGPRGEPILVRKPRPVGFRPERVKR